MQTLQRPSMQPEVGCGAKLNTPRRFGILGGVKFPPLGTFSEYIVVDRDQVIRTPEHLTDVQAAAWPVGGVTAWRFAFLPP
jgi:NADPH:quinone reductase-like Zn-dependent oxidoreductase